MSNETWQINYVNSELFECLKSITSSLKVLASKKRKRQSSFNPKFYAIYRHYIRYVQQHPWYTKKLSVIDFYCRILTIAYKCGLTDPKLVMNCKQDYLHIKNEYKNAHKYLMYLATLNDWVDTQEWTKKPEEINYEDGPHFHSKRPSRRFLVLLQYDPTSSVINNVHEDHIKNPLLKGLGYKRYDRVVPVDYEGNRQAFFIGECTTGYPVKRGHLFGISGFDLAHTPYSISNKYDYLKRLKDSKNNYLKRLGGDKNE